MLGQPFGEIERGFSADEILQKARELFGEFRIFLRRLIGLVQFQDKRHQRLGDELPAENAEMTGFIRPGAIAVQFRHRSFRLNSLF